ncbi:MAG: sigma-54-dependent Fis family transcriptional regulator [Deltaproteobacteria bacterium]|jgi:two-component system response regulator HydG|nr:sigma-54-dependent Fis family transcriptional regulator [Deltaproteobacteria bacterium]
MKPQILVVDDDRGMCELLELGLARRGFQVRWTTEPRKVLELLQQDFYEAVVTDLNMPGQDGIELTRQLVGNRSDLPVIVITAFGSMESAVEAMRAGAYDFVTKPLEVDSLALVLQRAVQHRALREEVKLLRRAVAASHGVDNLIGESSEMRRVFNLLSRVAEADVSVLVLGESGTGKELVARAVHTRSQRKDGPFIAVNCSALPEALLESELFGHTRGAFTDARSPRRGLFQQAHGGTVFLDEIGDLPLALQPRLLRALQERKVRPVGSDTEIDIDVRVLAATNQDLESAVSEKLFRGDLYYRLNVVQVRLPPLRARGNDVLLLAQHFLRQTAARLDKHVERMSPSVAERLLAYSWPGNVRELQNCIERAVALTAYDQLGVDDLPEKIRDYRPSQVLLASDHPSELVTMDEIERRYILRVLDVVSGNKSLAAQILGFDRRTLYRKLERYGISTRL